MQAHWVVPAFNVTEACHPGLGLRGEPAWAQQLRLQGREATISHRIVVGPMDGFNQDEDTSESDESGIVLLCFLPTHGHAFETVSFNPPNPPAKTKDQNPVAPLSYQAKQETK